MRTRIFTKFIAVLYILFLTTGQVSAQQTEPLNLQKAIDMALQNNHLLNIKKLQIEEKQAKVKEDHVKKYPAAVISSTYQYNANLGALVIPQGSFGALPLNGTTIALPNKEETFALGKHNNFNAGVSVYQPITQLGKIKTGVAIAETDVTLAQQEKTKASLQIKQAVERLYYGLLIVQKQKDEAQAKLELAQMKLYDVESALLSGKTIDVNKAGLQANIADEEQNLLKLNIQSEDYTADLKQLTGIKTDGFVLANVEKIAVPAGSLESYTSSATANNIDLKIANLGQLKTQQAIKAAQQSNRPDIGLIAGYSYQSGNLLYPTNNPFLGAQFKWNLQDLVANKQVIKQRNFLLQQARENIANTQDQVTNDVAKVHRKLSQATALIAVAEKALAYRNEELKIQQDKQASGLNIQADLLNTKSLLAKAEADLLSAQLNYRLAFSDLQRLMGEE
ncbi:TolC family protein [Dyadobacter sp. LHD-138]|uniref:TolC family protein n=1 Tax=Dyadobacter sp. LHD-138 TaxID=3071413 RepID=UPI0027DED492|nr:TolC family protein [Dyadobacter sp. LHD-138]MDQ6479160.1 TolC family protein [Dyadobacter sp. LHD-138]